jgi:hypothetical protein
MWLKGRGVRKDIRVRFWNRKASPNYTRSKEEATVKASTECLRSTASFRLGWSGNMRIFCARSNLKSYSSSCWHVVCGMHLLLALSGRTLSSYDLHLIWLKNQSCDMAELLYVSLRETREPQGTRPNCCTILSLVICTRTYPSHHSRSCLKHPWFEHGRARSKKIEM